MKDYSEIFTLGYCFGNIQEFNINYEEFIIMCKEVREKANDENKHENFDYCDSPGLRNSILKKECNEDLYQYFRSLSLRIMSDIAPEYNFIPTQQGHFGDLIALMEERGFSKTHYDGDASDITLLLYLSDPSEYNNSGKLKLMSNTHPPIELDVHTSDPIEGNYTLIETKIHNIPHKITYVYGDFKRLAYVGRIKRGLL
jgi:hypothetical protein